MKSITKEIKIGIISIFTLLLLYFGINYLKGINLLKPANYYYVVFEDVTGLTVSSPVYINGYKAGLVRSFEYEYNNPGHIVVEVAMDDELRISKGTQALFKTDLMGTGGITLKLDLGSQSFFSPGDTIPGVQQPGMMDKVNQDILPKLTIIMARMDTVLAGMQKVVTNPALNKSVDNLQQTTAGLSAASAQISKMMSNDMPQVINHVKSITSDFSVMSKNLKKIDYASAVSKIDSTMLNLRMATDKLNRTDNSMGLLLNDRSLFDSLSHTTGSANRLLIDLKANPKRYVHFSVFGKK